MNRKFSAMQAMRGLVEGHLAGPITQTLKGLLTAQYNIDIKEEDITVISHTLLKSVTEEILEVEFLKKLTSDLDVSSSSPVATVKEEPHKAHSTSDKEEQAHLYFTPSMEFENSDHVEDDGEDAEIVERWSATYFPILRDIYLRIVPGVCLNTLIDDTKSLPADDRPLFKQWLERINCVDLSTLGEKERYLLTDFQRIYPHFKPSIESSKIPVANTPSQPPNMRLSTPPTPAARKRGRKAVGRKTSKRGSSDESANEATKPANGASATTRAASKKKGLGRRQKKLLEDETWMAYFGQLVEWETQQKSFNVPRNAVVTADGVVYHLGDWLHKQRLLLNDYFERDTEKYEMLTTLAERGLWTMDDDMLESPSQSPATIPSSTIRPATSSITAARGVPIARSKPDGSASLPAAPTAAPPVAPVNSTSSSIASVTSAADEKSSGRSSRSANRHLERKSDGGGAEVLVPVSSRSKSLSSIAPSSSATQLNRKRRKIVFQRPSRHRNDDSSIDDSDSNSDSDSTYTRSSEGSVKPVPTVTPQVRQEDAIAQPKPNARPDARHLARKSFVRRSDESDDESDASPVMFVDQPMASSSIDAWNRNLTGQYIAFRHLSSNGEKVLSVGMVTRELLEHGRKEWEVGHMRPAESGSLEKDFSMVDTKAIIGYGDLLATNITLDQSELMLLLGLIVSD